MPRDSLWGVCRKDSHLRSATDNTHRSHLVFGSTVPQRTKRPSVDQLDGSFANGDWYSGSSWPEPFAIFWKRFGAPSRSEAKTIRCPSGDQTGVKSTAVTNVKRDGSPLVRSISQISAFPVSESTRKNTTRLSSGE